MLIIVLLHWCNYQKLSNYLLKLKLQYRKLRQHFNHYITYDNNECERSNLLEKVIPNSTKISKSTRIKSLIFYPFSKVLWALSISKRLQLPTFQQYALTVRVVLMGLQNILCNTNWMQNNVKETIVWHSIKKISEI